MQRPNKQIKRVKKDRTVRKVRKTDLDENLQSWTCQRGNRETEIDRLIDRRRKMKDGK